MKQLALSFWHNKPFCILVLILVLPGTVYYASLVSAQVLRDCIHGCGRPAECRETCSQSLHLGSISTSLVPHVAAPKGPSQRYMYIYIVYKLYMHILQWRSFSPCHRSKIDERQCTNRFFGLLCSSVPTIEVKPPELPALVFATSHLESLDEHQAGQTCNSTCDLQRHRG